MTIRPDERSWDDAVTDPVPKSFSQFSELGVTGVKRATGTVDEEFLPALRGRKAIQVFREMSQNDPIVGAMLFAFDKLIREVTWRVEPASNDAESTEAAEFVEQCMEDMSHSWDDFISEVLSSLVYGWSWHEIVYKKRIGPWEKTGKTRSKYTDGKIGWRKMPIRAQETMLRWIFDETGGIQGMVQLAPPTYSMTTIPIEKSLLFRTSMTKGNPEGKSLLRNAYRPWYFKKRLEEFEGIGVERDLAGMPVAKVPADYLSAQPGTEKAKVVDGFRKMVRGVRRDENEGLVLPNQYDADTKQPLFEFELMSSSGARQFDTNAIIQRYEQRILMTCLADFILVGHESVGSYSMHTDKSGIFRASLNAITKVIADTLNRHAIPRLFKANGWLLPEMPKIVPAEIDPPDLDQLAQFISATAGAGMQWFPDPELEKFLRDIARLPELPDQVYDMHRQQYEQTQAMQFAQTQMDTVGMQHRADLLADGYSPEQAEQVVNATPPELQMYQAQGEANAQQQHAGINPMGDPTQAAANDQKMAMNQQQDGLAANQHQRQLQMLQAQQQAEQGKAKLSQDSEKFNLTAEQKRLQMEKDKGRFTDSLENKKHSRAKELARLTDRSEDGKHKRAKDLFGAKDKASAAEHKRKLEQAKLAAKKTAAPKRPDPKNPKETAKKPPPKKRP